MAWLNCGGGSVQPPGATLTSAIATVGRAAASWAVAAVAIVTRINATITRPASRRRVMSCLLAGEGETTRRKGSTTPLLPLHQLIEGLADVLDRHQLTSSGHVILRRVGLGHDDARESHLRGFADAKR